MVRPKRTHRFSYKPVHPPKFPKPDELKVISSGGCWCGKSAWHTWPGQADGAPHPR